MKEKSKIVRVEKRALMLGMSANLVMAFAGWTAFNLSGSQALLLDGNMSFILFLTSLVAIKIATIKAKRSELFPFGLFMTEALYSLAKGLLLLGVVFSAIVSNGSKIIDYFNGETLPLLKTGVIVYYAAAMVLICWGLAFFYHLSNKKIAWASSMLVVEKKSSLIDGVLSAATGTILILIGHINPESSFEFLLYIGDAILVVVLALLLIGQPLTIIRGAFIELAGGKLQDTEAYSYIESQIKHFLDKDRAMVDSINISKTGSSYLVVVGVTHNKLVKLNSKDWAEKKYQLFTALNQKYTYIDLEVVVV